ncbi:unnamed protein product, partial [Mesorhabditis belari]|uniref:Glycosyltransferase family 92 protein n=1 Tax=Mesorhabditis belari TaxID=2138241 RepID=A0AAF3JBN5_9BILA
MELYQFLGYTKFLFTWTTMTKTVKKVLDYYVEKGIAELRPYPLVPYTDTVRTFVYLEDEKFLRNKDISLYEWMEEKVKNNSKIGAFSIRHFGLQMNPMLIPKPFNYEEFLKFDGLRGPTIFNNDRSPKAIFLTEFTRQPHTHWILKHFKQKHSHSASVDEIVYLHARASFAGAKLSKKSLNGTQNLMPDVDLLGKDVEEKLQKIRDVTKEIFGENPPPFSRETSEAMAKCTGNWLQKWRCRKPLTGCFDVVKYMEEWVFAKPSEENGWTIL